MREERFPVAWIHNLLYDRLKLLRKGVQATWDENTYTSLWVNLDLVALYTGVDDLMMHVFADENHFTPSAWRLSLIRDHPHSKGINMYGFYARKDGMIDVVVENAGSPPCSNYAKKLEDERKCSANLYHSVMERNQDVAKRFDETILSLLLKDEQAKFNLKLYVTPSKKSKDM
ncbi:hypothetical protein BGZ58_000913 [Dissophora ornata]|nr:hypothetical protein BGZ58_000913 [Dissophora ornata]